MVREAHHGRGWRRFGRSGDFLSSSGTTAENSERNRRTMSERRHASNWPLICPECGSGKITPQAQAGRTSRYRTLSGLPVPDDFEIPTCDQCGSEWIDAATAKAMDVVLEKRYREQLHKMALEALDVLSAHTSQRRLEQLLGLSHGYLSKIRSGSSTPGVTLVSCLRLLAVDPASRLQEMETPLRLAS